MNSLEQFEAAKYRELNDTAGVQLSASEFRWLCNLARRNPILGITLGPGPTLLSQSEAHAAWLAANYGPAANNAAKAEGR